MKNKQALSLLLPTLLLILFFGWVPRFGQVQAASMKNVTVLLSNSRFSFQTALSGAQTVGSSLITLQTTGHPSISVLQAQSGDLLHIGSTNTYTVATTIDDATDDKLSLTAGLLAADVTANLPVYSAQASNMTVKLTTVSALPGGKFRILVPAGDATSLSNDGVPDNNGFDFNSGTATITCPATYPGGFTSWTGAQAASTGGVQLGGVNYHSFTCAYAGTGAVNVIFDGVSYGAFIINNLINPSPATKATPADRLGVADTYSVIIQHLTSNDIVVDQTVTKIAVIDAVRVTATISPQLTFEIMGVASGVSKCGVNTQGATTPLAVPFGEITINVFKNLAQVLKVTTNAENGYQVTAIQNDQLGRDGRECPSPASEPGCIVDANVSGMSPSAAADWNTAAGDQYGFAYTLGAATTANITRAFYYNESSSTYNARHFADLAAGNAPQMIFSGATVAQDDQVDVCYRLTPAATNVAGDYENYIVYTATATF